MTDVCKGIYAPIFQSPVTNNLSMFSLNLIKRFLKKNDGNVELPVARRLDDNVVYWIFPKRVNMSCRTAQMFDYIVTKFTAKVPANAPKDVINANKEMILDLHEISALFKMSMHSTRELVIETINNLQNIKIEQLNISVRCRNKKPEDATVWKSVILQGVGCSVDESSIKNSKIKVILGDKLAEYLPSASIMPYSVALFSIKTTKFPNAYALGKHLNVLYKMNFYKPRRNIVSVAELVDVAPDIPKRETLNVIGGLRQRIIRPFIRDMNALVDYGVIKCWYFIDNVTNERFEGDMDSLDYDKFINMKVYFDFIDFPMKEESLFEGAEVELINADGKRMKLVPLKK